MEENKRIRPNLLLLAILFLFCLISCLAIKSAAPLMVKIPNPEMLWFKQLRFYGMSFIIMLIVYKFGNERIYRLVWVAYGILIIFLIGLVIERFSLYGLGKHIIPFAKDVNGATRWYAFPGYDFQPSEFFKIILIICLAKIIHQHNEFYPIHNFRSDCIMLGKSIAITALPCVLIFLQNDAGFTTLILVALVFILFASGLQGRWFIVGGAILILGILILVYIFMNQHEIFANLIGSTYRLNRFYGWVDPEGTYSNQGYQLFNALMAYGSGGMLGHGFQSVVISFPEAQTDFIFAVIAQNYGFIGGVLTILVITIFNFLLLRVGIQTNNYRDKYFVAGLFGLFIFQQVWNLSMVMGLLPITGITLPFLSYGGSSLLSYMIAMGMCLDIGKQTKISKSKSHY